MKKIVLPVLAGLMVSASASAETPSKYDTRFNVSANVPDSAMITDASGKPVTDLDVVLTAATSGKMEAQTTPLRLWNNDVTKLDVTLTLDDSQAATGSEFTLYSTGGTTLNSMAYTVSTISSAGTQEFTTSGQSHDYTLTANGTHGELPVSFKFVSVKPYSELGQGNYTGVVYANVVAKP